MGLTQAFAQDPQKQAQWQAFLRKNKLDALLLDKVVLELAGFLMPVFQAASTGTAFPFRWAARGPWVQGDAESRQPW